MLVSAAEGYRLWAASYDRFPNPLLALERRVLWGILGSLTGKRVVDVGCGTGRWTQELLRQGADVIGADLSPEMLCEAARKPRLRGRLLRASAMALPIASKTADLTICSFVISYLANAVPAFVEMRRIAKPGGAIVVSDLHPVAVAAGWTRSFHHESVAYEVEHHSRSIDELRRLAADAGLHFDFQIAAHFEEEERAIFRAAGKEATFEKIAKIPAVCVTGWRRP